MVLAFEPLHPEARELTLTGRRVPVRLGQRHGQIDFGDAPQIGDVFPVDAKLHCGSLVHLSGARLVLERTGGARRDLARTLLQFDAQQIRPQDAVRVSLCRPGGRPDNRERQFIGWWLRWDLCHQESSSATGASQPVSDASLKGCRRLHGAVGVHLERAARRSRAIGSVPQ